MNTAASRAARTEPLGRRRQRERKTVVAMLRLYCRHHHGTHGGLCGDCDALQTYALRRLMRCVFEEDKTTCANCLVHCYNDAMRERILEVMRYAGPRMLFRHPYLAIRHLLDGRKKAQTLHELLAQKKTR